MKRGFPSRREILAAAGACALPALFGWERTLRAAAPPKRLIILVTSNGTFPEQFWPRPAGAALPAPGLMPAETFSTGTAALDSTAFDLNPIGQPLDRHKKDLVYLEGLDPRNCDGHPGVCNLLSAVTPVPQGAAEVFGGGITFDQVLAGAIGRDTLFPTVQLGVRAPGGGSQGVLSFYDRLKGAPAENDPRRVLKRLFASVGQSPAEKAALARERAQQRSVLDAAMAQVATLRTRLGAPDRAKLEEYLGSFRAVEDRLVRLDQPGAAPPGACQRPADPKITDPYDVSQLPDICQAQMEVLSLAFACDLTRVATFQLGAEGIADFPYSFLGISQGHHDLSHSDYRASDAPTQYGKMAKISTWHATQIALLVDRLKALPEGNGSVFDNTLIVWMNGLRMGALHSNARNPLVLIGNAGSRLRTGRHVRLPRGPGDKIRTFADLFVTLARLYGVTLDRFGEAKFNNGPLEALL